MKALRLHVAINEFAVGAICLAVIICTVAYLRLHRPPAPAPQTACSTGVKEPTVEIGPIVYYIPVPVKVNVRVKVEAPKPAPEPPPAVSAPQEESDPVFKHRTPVITSALQQPMPK